MQKMQIISTFLYISNELNIRLDKANKANKDNNANKAKK